MRDVLRHPLDCAHPALTPRTVMVARLVGLVWIASGHLFAMPTVHTPWFPGTPFDGAPWVRGVLIYLAAVGVLTTWITPWVRVGCALTALSIGLGLLVDASWFSHNRLFTVAVLGVVAAMREPAHERWLWAQLGVLFLGAAWDKALDADWRSGRFLQSFVAELAVRGQLWAPGGSAGEPTLLVRAACLLGPASFAGISWVVIGLEGVVAWGAFTGSRWVAPLLAGFAVALVALTGSSLGMFVYLLLIAAVFTAPIPDDAWGARLGPWAVLVALLCTPVFSPASVAAAVAIGAVIAGRPSVRGPSAPVRGAGT